MSSWQWNLLYADVSILERIATRSAAADPAAGTQEEGSEAVPYTDIVKARAIRRAGRACEMCGMPLSFESARFVSAHPIFGILFDQDDCCVLCEDCLADLDPVTRAEAEDRPTPPPEDLGPTLVVRSEEEPAASEPPASDQDERATAENEAERARSKLPRAAREAWFPERGPDDDMCA